MRLIFIGLWLSTFYFNCSSPYLIYVTSMMSLMWSVVLLCYEYILLQLFSHAFFL
ncbi:hypothetical protein Sjap_023730 [Stephania japonica]|uniref:Uncharacterized protein n=1 Tax=Stephania japonica TaxID=461633 RepID=A0AAP0HJ86_9MAGN